nr:uncharacterized protein LOC117994091 [Maniola hyperantus]
MGSAINIMDLIGAEPQGLCGWEEIFTDFDSWLCKLNRHLNKRSSRYIQAVELSLEDSQKMHTVRRDTISEEEKEKISGSLTLQHLLVEGFSIENIPHSNYKSKMDIVKNLGNFLNIFHNGDGFADYDYLLIKLLSGGKKYFYQYTRSKLLFY